MPTARAQLTPCSVPGVRVPPVVVHLCSQVRTHGSREATEWVLDFAWKCGMASDSVDLMHTRSYLGANPFLGWSSGLLAFVHSGRLSGIGA